VHNDKLGLGIAPVTSVREQAAESTCEDGN
jgi:hypothetical protein